MTSSRSRGTGRALAASGSVLGIVAGVLQATVGSDIPALSGAKAAPVALGLLTIGLSVLVALGTAAAGRTDLSPGGRLAAMAAMVVPALVCFTTVGALWILPGALILTGAGLLAHDGAAMLLVVRTQWARVLLVALGGFELLMAAGASPGLMAVGVAGGTALIVGAGLAHRWRRTAIALLAVGSVPFAVVAWSALVPVLVLVLVVALTGPALHTRSALAP